MDAFISGLYSILSPQVFPYFIVLPILFQRLGKTRENAQSNIVYLSLSILFFLVLLFYYFSDFDRATENNNIPIIFIILKLLFAVYLVYFLIGFFIKDFTSKRIGYNVLRFFGITIFGVLIALVSFANFGPILGSLIVANANDSLSIGSFNYLLIFGIGLILPFIWALMIYQIYFVKKKNLSGLELYKYSQ